MAGKQQGNTSRTRQGKSAPSRASSGEKGGQRVRELVEQGRQQERRAH